MKFLTDYIWSVQSKNPILPLLRAWIRAQNHYLKMLNHEDFPWAYNERASLSLLAAAAWKSGGVALEEYSVEKRRLRADGQRRKIDRYKMGRCDLYIQLRSGLEMLFEAKHAWLYVGKENYSMVGVEKALSIAGRDAFELHNEEATLRYGLCFVSIYKHFPKGKKWSKESIGKVQRKLLTFSKDHSVEAVAWNFPGRCLVPSDKLKNGDERWFPGQMLLVKRAKYSRKN
jgi:hypothetical protein